MTGDNPRRARRRRLKSAASLEDIFAVMSAVSLGQASARVPVPADPQPDDVPTRLAVALNVLLEDFSVRAKATERMTDRLRILAEAAREFAGATQDPELLLSTVARRLAEVVKDLCIVRLVSDDGRELLPLAIHASDEDAERRTREMFFEPLPLDGPSISRRVHETGEPFVASKLDLEDLRARTTPKYLEYVRALELHSMLIVPLSFRGRSFGQILLARYRSDSPSFDDPDLNLARALADHAAIAIANSRSYVAERDARAVAEKAKDDLRASEARYRLMFDNSPLPKWMYDLETLGFLAVNAAAVRDYGYSREEFLGMTVRDIRPPEDVPAFLESVRSPGAASMFGTWRHRRKSGDVFQVEVTMHTFMLDGRTCRLAVGRDVTERLRLEEQLRHAQKMEAVGRLAGGVAHDFNNVLSVILSYGEMLQADLRRDDPMRGDLEEITKAAQRAAALTRQLLLFSRQQVVEPKVLDLNELLAGMDKMLRRMLGEDVDLTLVPAPELGRIRADAGNVEQVIMNLVVNARDAMPTGGQLTIETGNVDLDADYAREHFGSTPGQHVMLAVTDTGIGIDKATQARIFEPFFTTKEPGKGTGLGLSTVFGIAQQSGGSVWVYSEPGKGTTLKVYFPRVIAEIDVPRETLPPVSLRGKETILLVEDEEQVRVVAEGILKRNGYHVIVAQNAGEALLFCEKHPGVIHMLLTDVVMPQMSGAELAKRIAKTRPDMKLLCMSGYTDDSIVRHGVLESGVAFLQKPFTPESLMRKVRDVLDAPRGERPFP